MGLKEMRDNHPVRLTLIIVIIAVGVVSMFSMEPLDIITSTIIGGAIGIAVSFYNNSRSKNEDDEE